MKGIYHSFKYSIVYALFKLKNSLQPMAQKHCLGFYVMLVVNFLIIVIQYCHANHSDVQFEN